MPLPLGWPQVVVRGRFLRNQRWGGGRGRQLSWWGEAGHFKICCSWGG